MKFAGELKFPDIDHPGVPVQFVIDGDQAEMVVEAESLGRWSLYDVRARRLIASAFEIDLDGTEVTFVAADPIDFAYRGVEHMAQTWATMKSKRVGTRSIAVRKSRRGIKPSRIEDLRAAMESNLEEQGPRPIAGEPAMPPSVRAKEAIVEQAEDVAEPQESFPDWDQRDQTGAIPLVGGSMPVSGDEPEDELMEVDHGEDRLTEPEESEPTIVKSEEELSLEAEKRVLAEERARLEEERRAAEQREANLIEAYRLEVERLEAEREELRRQAAEAAERSAAERAAAEEEARQAAERAAAEEQERAEQEAAALAEMEREAAVRAERERQAREREAAVQAELERRVAEREAREREVKEREAKEREAAEREARGRHTAEQDAAERQEADQEAAEQEVSTPVSDETAPDEEEAAPATRPTFDASAFRRDVVDLDEIEDGSGESPPPAPTPPAPTPPAPTPPAPTPPAPSPPKTPQSEPALAGAPKEKSGGLMGAVKAAFRGGAKDHEHQFVEAPGGIGITRYVCEECGYVSISV